MSWRSGGRSTSTMADPVLGRRQAGSAGDLLRLRCRASRSTSIKQAAALPNLSEVSLRRWTAAGRLAWRIVTSGLTANLRPRASLPSPGVMPGFNGVHDRFTQISKYSYVILVWPPARRKSAYRYEPHSIPSNRDHSSIDLEDQGSQPLQQKQPIQRTPSSRPEQGLFSSTSG